MKRLSTSVILAGANLVVICLYFLGSWTHTGCCSLGSPANILAMVVVPIVLLASLFFVVRDLIRPPTRLQAVLALILSIPSALLLFWRHLS